MARPRALTDAQHRELERRFLLMCKARSAAQQWLDEAAKHSIAKIAADLGVKRTVLYSYLNGQRGKPA